MLITTMFIQLSEFNFAHGQPTCKALYTPQYFGTQYSTKSHTKQYVLVWQASAWSMQSGLPSHVLSFYL